MLHPQPQTQAANIWLPAVSHLGGCRWPSPSPQPSTPDTGLPMGIRGAWGRRNPGISAAGANIISWCPQQGQCIPSSCVGSAAPPGAPQSSHHSVTPPPCLWEAMLHSCVSQQITAYSLFFFTLIPRCPAAVPSLLRGLSSLTRPHARCSASLPALCSGTQRSQHLNALCWLSPSVTAGSGVVMGQHSASEGF